MHQSFPRCWLGRSVLELWTAIITMIAPLRVNLAGVYPMFRLTLDLVHRKGKILDVYDLVCFKVVI